MEAGLRIRRIQEVDRSWRLYRGLYEVAEVAFVRARSHSGRVPGSYETPGNSPQDPSRGKPRQTKFRPSSDQV